MCQNYWKYEISALNIPPSDNFQIGILRQSKFVQEVEHQFVIQVVGNIIWKKTFQIHLGNYSCSSTSRTAKYGGWLTETSSPASKLG